MRILRMRIGVSFIVSQADCERLKRIVASGNTPQMHVWRARIVLLTAAGHGTNEIMRRTGKPDSIVSDNPIALDPDIHLTDGPVLWTASDRLCCFGVYEQWIDGAW